MKESAGTLYGILPDGRVLIAAPMPDDVQDEMRVLWYDRDGITDDQRRKIFAINGEIAEWSGHDREYQRKNLTFDFLRQNLEQLQMSSLSLATSGNCDKGTASLFIDFLINFCLEHDVPTHRPLVEYAEDVGRYTYAALIHKRCVVCDGKAELHHVDAIGMGYNRREKPQIGALVLPLCSEHHREYHNVGRTVFCERYHVVPVKMDRLIAERYHLTKKASTEKTA